MEKQIDENPIPEPVLPPKSKALPIIFSLLVLVLLSLTIYLTYQNFQLRKQISQLQTQPSPTPTATADETANWKTYTHPTIKFTFMYPSIYKLETNERLGQIVVTDAESQNSFVINISGMSGRTAVANPTFENIAEDIKQYEQGSNANWGNFKPVQVNKQAFTVNGKSAIQYQFRLTDLYGGFTEPLLYDSVVWTFIKVDSNKLFWISASGKDTNTLDQILSTFRFTD